MKNLYIGQKVIWNGAESKQDKFDWLKKGMQGVVIKYQPEIKGTGKILDYDVDNEPLTDEGIEEYWTIDFDNAGKKCIDKEYIKELIIK